MKEKLKNISFPYKEELIKFIKKTREDSLDAISAQIAFFMIIAVIPFGMFILSLLQMININGISLLNSAIGLLPSAVSEFVLGLFPEDLELFTSLSIAAVACVWSSSVAMRALIKGMNRVFRSTYERGYLWMRMVSFLYTIVFALILVISVLLLIFGNTLYTALSQFLHWDFIPMLIDFKSLLTFMLLVVFFTLSYRFVPFKVHTKTKNCFIGALVAAGGWVLFSYFFSLFVENSARYSAVYGSLATLVIFMFWLYFCMYIMFLGGEIAVWLDKERENLKNIKMMKQKR